MVRRLVTAASIAALALLWTAPIGVAVDPLTVGSTEGVIYGGPYAFVDQREPDGEGETGSSSNQEWDIDVVNDPDWAFKDGRSINGSSPTGIQYKQEISASAGFHFSRAGELTSEVTAQGDLGASMSNVGEMFARVELNIPFRATPAATIHVVGNASATAASKGEGEANGDVSVSVLCTGAAATADLQMHAASSEGSKEPVQGKPTVDIEFASGTGECRLTISLEAAAEKGSSTFIESGHSASASIHFDLKLTAPVSCEMSGFVRDGNQTIDGHAKPLTGIPVVVAKGDTATAIKAVTDRDGRFCLHGFTAVDLSVGGYVVRAALVDAAHDPSLLRTLHDPEPADVTTDRAIGKDDLASEDVDIEFSKSSERPWLADVANIHWQSTRFVDWLVGPLGIAPATVGAVTVNTFDSERTSYSADHVAHITQDTTRDPNDSLYQDRDGPTSEGPENLEWHEIGHHVAHALGIAATDSAPECIPRVPHAGWQNKSTCDSLQEGFANFLSLLGSVTLDAAAGPGYATTDYASFGVNLEANDLDPQSTVPCSGTDCPLHREDFAAAQLLWDLVDAQASPNLDYAYKSVRDPDSTGANVLDEVSLKPSDLLTLMVGVTTVAELRDALHSSSIVPAALKKPSVDITKDGKADISKIDAVFLMHGFHASRFLDSWEYTLGDPIGSTDHTTGGTDSLDVIREKQELAPGYAIRLVNPTSIERMYTIDVDHTSTSSHFEVVVSAASELIFSLELPPYWHGVIESPANLPECSAADEHLRVTVKISAPGLDARTLTNCEFIRAAATTAQAYAISVGGELQSPAPSGAPSTTGGEPGPTSSTVVIALVVLVIGVVVVASFVLARRRRAPSAE